MVSIQDKRREAVYRAIADPTRREILGLLRGGEQTVGALAANFRMSRPAVSKHLRVLGTAGLVETRKRGTTSRCRLNARPLREVSDWVSEYATFWAESLESLKKYVEEQ